MSQMQPPTQQQQSSQLTNTQQPSQVQGIQMQAQSGQQAQAGEQAQTGQLFPTRNFLDQNVRTTSIATLNQVLADLTAVNMQIKTAHWNVRGPDFYQLHELFEDLVETFEPLIDTTAERATALGGQALGTATVVAQQSTVPQMQPAISDQSALLQQVADSLTTLDATLYNGITACSEMGDLDTADLLNEVSRAVSKALWFVEAHLQGGGVQQASQQGAMQQQQQIAPP